MKFNKTDIDGCYLITYDTYVDSRGYFSVPYNKEVFNSNVGYDVEFVQDNMSYSHLGTIRGLHYQSGVFAQAKLVSCTQGRVLDVAVDIRKDSPTYGNVVKVELGWSLNNQLFVYLIFKSATCFKAYAFRSFDFNFLLLASTLILSRHVQDSVCIDVEGDFDLRHASWCRWNVRKLESTDGTVVLCHRALALKDVQVYCRLVVRRGREDFRLLGRNGGIGLDQLGEYPAHGFDT